MLDISISVRLENETEPVVSTPNMGTLLRLERFFGLPSAIEALQQTKLEHVAWLAWESRRHAGLTVPTWEKFRDSVADIDFESENDSPLAEEAPPTV